MGLHTKNPLDSFASMFVLIPRNGFNFSAVVGRPHTKRREVYFAIARRKKDVGKEESILLLRIFVYNITLYAIFMHYILLFLS